jgi:hypothetical protein
MQPAAVIPSITLPVPPADACTVNCVAVECVNKPDVPVTFKLNVPGVVASPGLTVISDDVGLPRKGVTEFGLNDAVTPAAPDTVSVTAALNSPVAFAVTNDAPDPPTSAVIEATGPSEKLPIGIAATNASFPN